MEGGKKSFARASSSGSSQWVPLALPVPRDRRASGRSSLAEPVAPDDGQLVTMDLPSSKIDLARRHWQSQWHPKQADEVGVSP